jgi:hypothetical protein
MDWSYCRHTSITVLLKRRLGQISEFLAVSGGMEKVLEVKVMLADMEAFRREVEELRKKFEKGS